MEKRRDARQRLISWRGLMADDDQMVRKTVIAILALLSAAMVATQTNYFVVGDAHLIAVLAPITACALLAGPKAGALVGAIAGAAEWLHATLLPLDAYEQYFATPVNSVLLFAVIGLVMGLMYAVACNREYDKNWKGVLALVVACAIGSALFTLLFSISANIINALVNIEIPSNIMSDLAGNKELVSQVVANFGLMALLVMAFATLWYKRESSAEERTLSRRFQGWLFAVMCAAYLLCAAGTYTVVSIVCRNSAESQMQSQINYLSGQLKERDDLIGGLQRRGDLSEQKAEDLHANSVSGVALGLSLGERGVSAVAEDDVVVSSSDASMIGKGFTDVVGAGFLRGFDQSLYDANRSSTWYMNGSELGYLRVSELSYLRVSRQGSYQIMVALPQAEVYQWRPVIVLVVSGVFLALFAAVYAQASLLLKNVVVRDIDQTNEVLGRITEGELDQSVKVRDTVEFARLSDGINATVGTLRDAIATEAARNDRDLATAKAIQESALPRSFPPFPEVDAFDIYASMNAAREVGGDFYDFFLLDDDRVCFLIADVSGKGIPASLFMMAAKTEIASNIRAGMALGIAMQTANWHLCQGNDAGMFVTVWTAILDYKTGKLTYVNAGHNPPLLRHKGSWEWLKARSGLFLGTFETAKYHEETVTLVKGDELFLYTDGVNEAFSATEEQYGDDRVEAFLADHADLHPHALVDAMRAELRTWAKGAEQSDDITMLSIEYGAQPEATGSISLDATTDNTDAAIDLVRRELTSRYCPITVQHKVDIALEELFVNVCKHAYAEQDGPGKVQVDYVFNANPNSITVSVTDWGTPFDPLDQSDPTAPESIGSAKIGGLGILMVKKGTDDLSYLRDGDANVVAFRCSW